MGSESLNTRGDAMNRTGELTTIHQQAAEQRATNRQSVGLPGRLVWKDARGATRFNTVVIRDISETGAYVENVTGAAIPLFRLVSLQAEREVAGEAIPLCLRHGRVLSAIFRVGPARPATGTPEGYGLRLLVEPKRRTPLAGSVHEPVELAAVSA